MAKKPEEMNTSNCYLCGIMADIKCRVQFEPLFKVKCDRCGIYEIGDFGISSTKDNRAQYRDQLYLVSGVTRYRTENNLKLFRVTDDLLYEPEEFQAKVLSVAPKNVESKIKHLLQYIALKSTIPSDSI
ncbi:MAG: hypothetical protein ACYTE8_07285, partial [Planctomycetota bacterium]